MRIDLSCVPELAVKCGRTYGKGGPPSAKFEVLLAFKEFDEMYNKDRPDFIPPPPPPPPPPPRNHLANAAAVLAATVPSSVFAVCSVKLVLAGYPFWAGAFLGVAIVALPRWR